MMRARTLALLGCLAVLLPVYIWTRTRRANAVAPLSANAVAPVLANARTVDLLPELEASVPGSPTDAPLRTRLATELGRQGHLDRARQQLERAVALDARLPEARHNLGLVYLNSGRVEAALAQFLRELELRPGDADVHLVLGQTYLSLRNTEESLRHLRLSARLRPGHLEGEIWLARAAYFAGDTATAEEALKQAAALPGDPAYCWYLLGRLYSSQQRYGEALAAARKAVDLASARAHHHLLLAQVLEHERDYSQSIREYQRALQLEPDLGGGSAELGHVLVLERRFSEAIPYLERGREQNPDDGALRRDLAATYRALGRTVEAEREQQWVRAFEQSEAQLKVLRKRAELQPRSVEAWFALGRGCLRLQRFPEGEQALRTVLRLQPEHAGARQALEALRARQARTTPFETEASLPSVARVDAARPGQEPETGPNSKSTREVGP